MDSNLLLWLALPLLAVPMLARSGRSGGAASQLVIAVLGLAALRLGVGTLDPGDLRTIAGHSRSDAWFIGLTSGALMTGAGLFPEIGNWRKALTALPFEVGLIMSIPALAIVPLVIGAAIGLLPTGLGFALRRGVPPSREAMSTTMGIDVAIVGLLLLTAGAAWFGPAALAAVGLTAAMWRAWWIPQPERRTIPFPLLPVIASITLGTWVWLALTIAGSPWVTFRELAHEAPISFAAGQWLALLTIGWSIAIAAPWPLDRIAPPGVLLPVLAIVLYLASSAGNREGIEHWQPMLSTVLVIAALAAAALGRWPGAASALVLLAATRAGAPSLGAAVTMAFVPVARHVSIPSWRSLAVGLSAGAIAASVLRDQALLGILLGFGLAAIAVGTDHVVAPTTGARHL